MSRAFWGVFPYIYLKPKSPIFLEDLTHKMVFLSTPQNLRLFPYQTLMLDPSDQSPIVGFMVKNFWSAAWLPGKSFQFRKMPRICPTIPSFGSSRLLLQHEVLDDRQLRLNFLMSFEVNCFSFGEFWPFQKSRGATEYTNEHIPKTIQLVFLPETHLWLVNRGSPPATRTPQNEIRV